LNAHASVANTASVRMKADEKALDDAARYFTLAQARGQHLEVALQWLASALAGSIEDQPPEDEK